MVDAPEIPDETPTLRYLIPPFAKGEVPGVAILAWLSGFAVPSVENLWTSRWLALFLGQLGHHPAPGGFVFGAEAGEDAREALALVA